ncbi:hypothetical protein ACOME3_002787 [Neoechinorhynchus agilis]
MAGWTEITNQPNRMSARAQRKAEYLLNKNAPELHPYNQTFVYTIHKAPAVSLTINPRQIARIVCNQWYCEKKNYHRTDFDNERERLDRSARYTQMIWRRSYMAGFGYATIANDDRIDAIVVGFFDEPGNVHGSFDENVQSIDRGVNECNGATILVGCFWLLLLVAITVC